MREPRNDASRDMERKLATLAYWNDLVDSPCTVTIVTKSKSILTGKFLAIDGPLTRIVLQNVVVNSEDDRVVRKLVVSMNDVVSLELTNVGPQAMSNILPHSEDV